MDGQITLHSMSLASFKGLSVSLVTILLFQNQIALRPLGLKMHFSALKDNNFKTSPSIFIVFGTKTSFIVYFEEIIM